MLFDNFKSDNSALIGTVDSVPPQKALSQGTVTGAFWDELVTGSAIAPALARVATGIIEDTGYWEPTEALGQEIKRFGHCYRSLLAFYQESGELWQGKPENPRKIPRKDGRGFAVGEKVNKYEATKGAGNRPYLPPVDAETRQAIGQALKVYVPLDGCFWDWVEANPQLPITFTEGGKKSLCLLSHGEIAIALYGVNAGYRVKDDDGREIPPALNPHLERFCVEGRPITLAFDQDDKPSTRAKVAKALHKTAALLIERGCTVAIARWESSQGKGVDDLIAAHGIEAYQVAHRAKVTKTAVAKTLSEANRLRNVARAMAILKAPTPEAHRRSWGGFLPPLPPLGQFQGYAIDAPMGSGKTVTIGRDIVTTAREAGSFTLELSPRNSLGQQGAKKHGLVHIHDFGTDRDSTQALGIMATEAGGIVLCPNSLPRAAHLIPQNFHLVIDEVMATLREASEGSTLKGKYSEAWDMLIDLMRRAQSLTISEANLDQATLLFVETLSGKRLQVIRHHVKRQPWSVHLCAGDSPTGMFAAMASDVEAGKRVWLLCTSVDESYVWHQRAIDRGITSVLVNGETNEGRTFDQLFAEPDAYLEHHRPQLLITTQSVQTGLSVEGDHFDAVYAYAPGFAVGTIYQMLGRYRRPVPRYIWVPAFISPSRWEKPRKTSAIAEITHELSQWAGKGFAAAAARPSPEQAAIDEYMAAQGETAWAQKIAPGQTLTYLLESAGHTVTEWHPERSKAIAALREEYREKLARTRAQFHAELAIDPDTHTAKWQRAKRESPDATYRDRCILVKLATLEKFPGIDWDCPEIWYQAFFRPRQRDDDGEPCGGPLAPGAALWAECLHSDTLQTKAGEEASTILAQRLRSIRLLPDYGAKLAILAPLQKLCEHLVEKGRVDASDRTVQRLASLARAMGEDLNRYLRITASDEQSDVAIACKFLRKFGLTLKRSTCHRRGRSRHWSYTIHTPELWRPLVEARCKSLETLRGSAHSRATDLLENPFNKSVAPLSPDLPPDTWAELRGWLRDAVQDGKEVVEAFKQTVIDSFGTQAWEALSA